MNITSKKDIAKFARAYKAAIDKGHPPLERGNNEIKTAARIAHEKLGQMGDSVKRTKQKLDKALALGMDVPGWASALTQEQEATIRARYGVTEIPLVASPAVRSGRVETQVSPPPVATPDRVTIQNALKRKPLTLEDLATKLGVPVELAHAGVEAAARAGATVVERGGKYHLDDEPAIGGDNKLVFQTDKNGYFEFAACSDEHLCSKYERLDCLNDYYDQIERRGLKTVFNAGNWIDGEATFNRHDLLVHGLDNQMRYLAKNYPQRKGVDVYAITGADHEGWYARSFGVDVGKYAENTMREAGRTDWHNLGYMEAFVKIQHPESGKASNICIMHPGGGSSYAVSYAPQKIVEGFDSGDKPAVLLVGHYHKSGYNLIRSVHTMQTGTFMSQSVFMRQKKLSAHLGGCFVKIHVDERTGAVDECSYTFRNYFNRDYYNGQWSQHGLVNPAKRSWKAEG